MPLKVMNNPFQLDMYTLINTIHMCPAEHNNLALVEKILLQSSSPTYTQSYSLMS